MYVYAMKDRKLSVNGHWQGSYLYSGNTKRHNFSATFFESAGSVQGSIIDSDRMGEASIAGTFEFPDFNFTKLYDNPQFLPVSYQGAMSDDGKTIAGIWHIKSILFGSWVAHRNSEQEQDKSKEIVRGKKQRVREPSQV